MAKTQEELSDFLRQLGIAVETVRHPPLYTVAESQALRGSISGAHTKNLFLKDKKDNYFLVTVEEAAEVNLKVLHHEIGAASRVSFGKSDAMMELLGVLPGAVTIFGLINDIGHRVKAVIAEDLLRGDVVNAHPLTNAATTSICSDDLLRFLDATGHQPLVLKL